MNLRSVVSNWGDMGGGSGPARFGSGMVQEGIISGPAYSFEDYAGAQRHVEAERGYANPWRRFRESDGPHRRRYQNRLHAAVREVIMPVMHRGRASDVERFQEAMSIGDFPNLFGDIIDRAVLANYLETPYTWNLIAHQATVNNFLPVKRFRVDGGTGLLGPTGANSGNLVNSGGLIPLDQGANYPEDYLTVPSPYEYQLFKRGKRMPFFWETLVNDDLNALKDTPARFGRGARREEEYFVTALFANNSTFYSNTNKNLVNAANAGGYFTANDPALSITALQQAIAVMMLQTDTTGQPISVEAMTLVVPPSLKTIAMNILNTDFVFMADQGGTQQINGVNLSATLAQQLHAMNWAKNIVRLAVNYYLPIVDTVHGQTGWYLFANPESGRPAIEYGVLRGHENPELFMKLPNSVAIGEGTMGPGPGIFPGTTEMNPMEGDFDTDSVHYKIRCIKGGTVIDPIMSVYSNGTNS
jgi:hypothetical protein